MSGLKEIVRSDISQARSWALAPKARSWALAPKARSWALALLSAEAQLRTFFPFPQLLQSEALKKSAEAQLRTYFPFPHVNTYQSICKEYMAIVGNAHRPSH